MFRVLADVFAYQVYSLLDKKRMSRGADLIRGNVLMQTRVRRILGSNDQKPQWVPLLASRTQQMKSGPTLNGKKADVEVMESGPALGGKEANEGSMNQSQNASEYVCTTPVLCSSQNQISPHRTF